MPLLSPVLAVSAVLLLWVLHGLPSDALPIRECDVLLADKESGHRIGVPADCRWSGPIDGGTELKIIGSPAAADALPASSTAATPILWAPGSAAVPAVDGVAVAGVASTGTRLHLERLELVGFDIATSSGGSQPMLWPAQLVSSGTVLSMTDVRLVVKSQAVFDTLRKFFTSDNKIFQWTDNSTFVHIASWSDARTQLLSVGILLEAPAAGSHTPLRTAAPQVKNCLVAATNTTLVPYLLANAAVVTPQPLLVYITSNVSIGLHPALPATGILIGRPLILVGLQSLVTSVDFEMEVNQLNASVSRFSNVTLVGLVLENTAPGDAATSTVAAPFSITISNNLWAVFYNRTVANDVRLALFNCTMVLPMESEMAYVTYMFTLYTSSLPYLRQQTSFYSDVLHMSILQFVPGPGSKSVTVERLKSWYHWWNNLVLTTRPIVAKPMALPPRPLVLATPTRTSPLVQAVHSAADLEVDSEQVVVGDRAHILLLLSDVNMDDISTGGSTGSAGNPLHLQSTMSWIGTSPVQPAAEAWQDAKQSSSSSSSSGPVTLNFVYQRGVVVIPPTAGKDALQLQQLVLRGLPQGPSVSAVVDGRRIPPELFTVLLWSISRDMIGSQLSLDGITMQLPGPEFDYLLSMSSTATDFVVELAGHNGDALTFQDVVRMGDESLHAGSFQGPGVSGINLTLNRDPDAAALMPGGYAWPSLSSLPHQLSPSQPGWVVPVVAVCMAVVAVVAMALGFVLWRRQRAASRCHQSDKVGDGSVSCTHSCQHCSGDSERFPSGGSRSPCAAARSGAVRSSGHSEINTSSCNHSWGTKGGFGGVIVPLNHAAFYGKPQEESAAAGQQQAASKDADKGAEPAPDGQQLALLPQEQAEGDVAALRDVAVPVHIADSLVDHVAAGMQRWRAAVSSTTMLLMERRMDAAAQPVGSGASGSTSSCGKQASNTMQGRQEDVEEGGAGAGAGAAPNSQQTEPPFASMLPSGSTPPQLVLQEVLGQGSFGSVYLATWRGKRVAVKVMQLPANALLEPPQDTDQLSENTEQLTAAERQRRRRARQLQHNSPPHMAIMEAVVSSTMSHPNVVQVYTYMLNPLTAGSMPTGVGGRKACAAAAAAPPAAAGEISGWELKLVMEYCDEGSLRDALDCGLLTNPGSFLAPSAVLTLAHDVAAAMLHLHSEGIVHGDLKAGNVMLTSHSNSDAVAGGRVYALGSTRRLVAKVADFGLAMPLGPSDTHATLLARGTPTHMPPELFMAGHVSKASDVYAYGILLFEIVTGQRAYAGVPIPLLPHEVARQGLRPQWPAGLPPGCRDLRRLAEACWAQKPQDRPSFQDILQILDYWAAGGHGWPLDRQSQQNPRTALTGSRSGSGSLPAAAAAGTLQQPVAGAAAMPSAGLQQGQQGSLAPGDPLHQQLQLGQHYAAAQQERPQEQQQEQQGQPQLQQVIVQPQQLQVKLQQELLPQGQLAGQVQALSTSPPKSPAATEQQQVQQTVQLSLAPAPSGGQQVTASRPSSAGGPGRKLHMDWSEVDYNDA